MKHTTSLPRRAGATTVAAAALLLAAAAPATSRAADPPPPAAAARASASATDDLADGEVRKVDADQGRLTLRHGEIKPLDMPAMTMVFQVKDKALLAPLKPGDKIRFKVVRDNGKLLIVDIQPAP